LDLGCLTCPSPTGQVSDAGEPSGAWVPPQGWSCCPSWALCRGRPLGAAAAGSSAGQGLFSCRCAAFPVGRARLPSGFLPCRPAGRGGGCLRQGAGAAFLLVWFSFPAGCGSRTALGLRRVTGRAREPAGRSLWPVSAASVGLGPSADPAAVPVPACSQVRAACGWPSLSRCIARRWRCPSPGPSRGPGGSWRSLVQGLLAGLVPRRWRGCGSPPRWS